MSDDDMSHVFREELRDLLDSLERGLMDLRAAPGDMGLVNQVFRDLHTVKGSGAMFGFVELAAFIHRFETVFDRVRAGEVPVSAELIRLSLAARDEIPGLVDGQPDPNGQREAILARLVRLAGPAGVETGAETRTETGSETAAEALTASEMVRPDASDAPGGGGSGGGDDAAEAADEGVRVLTFGLLGDALGLGARPDVILAELRGLGAMSVVADLSDVPNLPDLDPDACHIRWRVDLPASVTEAVIEDVFVFAEADWTLERFDSTARGHDFGFADAADEAAAGRAEALGGARTAMGQDLRAGGAAMPLAPMPEPAGQGWTEPGQAAPAQTGPAATVRVPAERLDALMDAVGELVIFEARLTELARQSRDAALITTAEQITRLAAGLRDATMTMRMVPMRSLVGRFRRLIGGLSDSLGKPVSFTVLGEDTELDKTVIEKLADPLVHVLRNAIDHGMETADERLAAGKPATGLIELSAEHAGAEVLIRVRDDGRGMDPARIRAKAVAQGLIPLDATLTEAQTFALIFEPGFSTAETVTELSGRGVGMDVVRRTIDGLRGAIEIDSGLGRGTCVTLRLPLTLAIIEGLLVEVGGEKYTLPMAAVHEIVALPPDRVLPQRAQDFLDIRGRFVPFLRLRSLFDCRGEPGADQNVVIVSLAETRVGIVVDRIVGTNQTVIKQMSKLHSGVRAVSGATILGDGSVALILDVGHLIALGGRMAGAGQAATGFIGHEVAA